MAARKPLKPIKKSRQGSLTAIAGKGKNGKINDKKVKQLEKAPGNTGAKARYYENVLKPAAAKKRKKK